MSEKPESRPLLKFAPALFLLTVSFIINYVDRGNISVAGPLIKRDFHLSDSELGILFSAFFFTYTAMQFLIGWLVDRLDANWILAAGFLLWSAATATTGLVRGFVLLLIIRFILGIGESVALPCGSKILAENLPEHYRGFASGCAMSGLKWGNVIGTIGAGFLMADFGWRPVFIAVGLVSLLWLPAWVKWMPHCDRPSRAASKIGPGFWDILSQRSFWGTSAGHFATNYLFYFLLTWLPSYLVLERHLSIKRMALVAGLCYGVDALSAISTGWLQDFAILRGYTPTLVRKSAMVIGFSMAAIGLLGCALASANSFIPWLLAAGFGCGMTGPGLYTFPQTLAGSAAVGKWYGWQNGFANFAGVTGPALTGFVLQHTGKFFAPFAITAAICICGAFAWVLIVGRVEEVKWADRKLPAFAISNVNV
ncbi:MAG TPA: MFS transporter [Terriglobales bacterium]|jgi:MFS family permease|nr:MFS transporter [Terriglobales bacterium]